MIIFTSLHRAVALVSLAIIGGCAKQQHAVRMAGQSLAVDATVAHDLDRLREATRPFQNLDAAVAAGYPREVADCLVHEKHGAMGYHHVNRTYLAPTLDITRPPILLYERMPDGKYQLNGVEFIIPYRLYSRDSTAPVFLGQRLKREDNLNIWYVHVWAWKENTSGVFADFNPAVKCQTGKPYEPFTRPGE